MAEATTYGVIVERFPPPDYPVDGILDFSYDYVGGSLPEVGDVITVRCAPYAVDDPPELKVTITAVRPGDEYPIRAEELPPSV
jgi:hypothetical protein